MRIRLTVNGQVITGTLADNATSRDFFSMLPMALELDDYAATEKISSLPRRLSTAGAPPGIDPSVGDLAYYAPWGNIAIFIKDFEYSKGLVSLGRIDSDIAVLSRPGPVQVTVEPVKE